MMATKEKVLQLLKDSSEFLSGEKIAQQLQVSRTSIWKAIKELEKAGYQFEHQAKGYRYLLLMFWTPKKSAKHYTISPLI